MIGGIGPMSTVYFLEMIVRMTDAVIEQEHLNMVVYNMPSISDRTHYILNHKKDTPIPHLTKIIERLNENEVDCIAMPCITAHCFFDTIREEANSYFINAIEETRDLLVRRNIRSVGMLATDGTISSKTFQKTIEQAGIKVMVPDKEYQNSLMDIIYNQIKCNRKVDGEQFGCILNHMKEKGVDIIILGCTELSLIKKELQMNDVLDMMEVLAVRSIELCGHNVKHEYMLFP